MTAKTPLRITHHNHLSPDPEPLRRERFERILDGAASHLDAIARGREVGRRPTTSPTSDQQAKEER